MAEFKYSSLFGKLTEMIQLYFDAVSEKNKQLFDNVQITKYCDWDTPSEKFDFEAILGKYNISVAAPTIGLFSKEPVLGSEGLETFKEEVLHHAIDLPMREKDQREILSIMASGLLTDETKKQKLIKLMFGDVNTVVASIYSKLDLIFLGALSNEGVFELNATNNPEGGVRGTINYNQPAENIVSATTQWTDANIETVDCFEDIQEIMELASDKVTLAKILLSPAKLHYMLRTKKMKQLIWGTDKSSRMVNLKDVNSYLQENDFPILEPIRRTVRIQNGRSYTEVKPWNTKNIVFVPAGKLGTIKNALDGTELKGVMPEPGLSVSKYERVIVKKWCKGESDGSNHVEHTKAESYSLPVIEEINGIYTLKTEA